MDDCGNEANCVQIISVTPLVTTPDCSNFFVTASEDITICNGSTAQLSATGALVYTWTPTTGLNDPFSANPAASPSSTTTYTVTGINGEGCEAQAEVTVIVANDPGISAGQDIVICQGQATQLSASGGLVYSWSPTTGLSDPTSASPMASPDLTTTYTVSGTDANGCTAIARVTAVSYTHLTLPTICSV